MLNRVAVVLALALAAPVVAVPADPVDAAAVDAVVRAYRDTTRIPGVAVAVTRGRTVVHAAGYGRTGNGAAVTDRTVMAVASLSKSVTALAVMQLVDAGRVRLDVPARTYLPEFVMADARSAAITVRQLLNHTSGMSDRTYRTFDGPTPRTPREAVAALRDARLAADPGSRHEYHNPNYQVAARLVEVVSGQPFDGYLRRHVFGPLGMVDSRTGDTADDLPASGRGHLMIAGVPVALPEPPAFGNGSGGVLSTVRDMAAWLVAHNNQGRGADGTPVVSPAAVTEMHRPTAGSYGLGWNIERTPSGAPLVEHTGGLITVTAYQALLPATGYGIVVLANAGSQYGDAPALGARLIALLEGRPVSPPPSPAPLIGIDVGLLLATAGSVALTVRGVRAARRWVAGRRRPVVAAVLRSLPYLVPLLLLANLHRVVGWLYRGRDISWPQAVYLYPTFTVLLAVVVASGVVVTGVRLLRVRQVSTSGR